MIRDRLECPGPGDVLVLSSGGMDSTVLLWWLLSCGARPVPAFVDYAQHSADTELATLKRVMPAAIVQELQLIRVRELYESNSSALVRPRNLWTEDIVASDLYLPGRNLTTLSVALARAESIGVNAVMVAFIQSNIAEKGDRSHRFMQLMSSVAAETSGIELSFPFLDLTKVDIVRLGIELDVPIGLTFSCQAARAVPCGACPNCRDRLDALAEVRISSQW